jgi:hypothetical protein
MTSSGLSGDPEFEAERREQMHRLRQHAAHGHIENPLHVLALTVPGVPPGARVIALAHWSLAARLVRDATDGGHADEVADLGPDAMALAGEYNPDVLPANVRLDLGIAKAGKWIMWFIPGDGPPEPPPAW